MLLAVLASVVFLLGSVVYPVHAQTTLTVKTNKDSYVTGDNITITGNLNATNMNQPLLLQVQDPQDKLVRVGQLNTSPAGSYNYTLRAGGTMRIEGTYTVIVSYDGTTSETTTFKFNKETDSVLKTFTLKVDDQSFQVQYMFRDGSITGMIPDGRIAGLNVIMNSTADGKLKIRLPRNVIDSRAGEDGKSGADQDFVIFANGMPSYTWEETNTTGSVRTLSIDFAQGTETIEIVGTWAIPEFGAIAAIILAVAIVGIIVATATYSKKFNFAPRL
jgi:predicted secreted protein with PEFG-CTERM motif